MLSINIEISGDKEVIKKLKKIQTEFQSWKPELKQIGDFLKSFYANDVFETEGGVFNDRWKPLSPRYEARKRKEFPGRGILERSGKMRRGFITKADANSLKLFNNLFYAQYHQKGRGVPKRIMAQLDKKRQEQVTKLFKKGVIKRLEKIAS